MKSTDPPWQNKPSKGQHCNCFYTRERSLIFMRGKNIITIRWVQIFLSSSFSFEREKSVWYHFQHQRNQTSKIAISFCDIVQSSYFVWNLLDLNDGDDDDSNERHERVCVCVCALNESWELREYLIFPFTIQKLVYTTIFTLD